MKLLHTSDWHLGMPVGTGSYKDCQEYFFQRLYDLIRAEGVETVICAGDIYDTGVANAEAIGLFNQAATTLCGELGVKLIVIAGNHDSAPRLSACSELLKASGLYIFGRLGKEVSPVLLDDGKVAVYCLPFFGRDEVIALFPAEKERIRSLETAMDVVCDHIREKMDKSRKNILVSHAMVVNAELSESDRSARVGFASAVSKDVFRDFDYVALGHIHKPQVIDTHICYSGSPVKYSFGSEETQEKGVVIIDTDTMEQRFVSIPPLRDRKTVEGTYDEIIQREDLQDSYLRLRLTDRYAGLELISQLRSRFPYLLEIYGKGIAQKDSVSSLSVEELERLDEEDILERFFGENFDYAPTDGQLALFRDVLAWSQEVQP